MIMQYLVSQEPLIFFLLSLAAGGECHRGLFVVGDQVQDVLYQVVDFVGRIDDIVLQLVPGRKPLRECVDTKEGFFLLYCLGSSLVQVPPSLFHTLTGIISLLFGLLGGWVGIAN